MELLPEEEWREVHCGKWIKVVWKLVLLVIDETFSECNPALKSQPHE
jgi:hypothetical protein